jgi:hypothetical protein
MSRANVEVARGFYPDQLDLASVFADEESVAANRRALEPFVDPDFETVADPSAVPMAGRPAAGEGGHRKWAVRGIDGFVAMWEEFLSAWDSWVVNPHEFIAVDEDRVLVLFEMTGRPKGQTAEIPVEGGNLLTFRDRKLTRLELFFKRDEALQAAGLER